MTQTVVVAGISGDLGRRIGAALVQQGANVKGIIRSGTPDGMQRGLESRGITLVESAYKLEDLANICRGADCVVSALNGLEDVILRQQGLLLTAALVTGVPRFVPSDFSLDYTRTTSGENRNLDLRRRFRDRLNTSDIRATSILNGAFSTILTHDAPIILTKIHRVLHWGDVDQKLDFTTKDDVAEFTASAALDPKAPRDLRIAGGSLSPREIAALVSELSGHTYKTLRAGGIDRLSRVIRLTKAMSRAPDAIFPAWQGMQYMRDMMSGRGHLSPLDNARYGKMDWTDIRIMIQ